MRGLPDAGAVDANVPAFDEIGGVGARAAVVVLILYGLLPIVRTTIAGLTGIDPSIREAGVAMGMTPRELLRYVELPLALPSIVAGIRVAAVVGVGSATIAAAIGAVAFVLIVIPVGKVRAKSRGAEFETPLVPFGVFLAPAAAVALFWGDAILQWYLGRLLG